MRVDKYTKPTKLDVFPYGTLWRVIESTDQYVQASKEKDTPQWLKVDEVLGTIAYRIDPSERTVRQILNLYQK